MFAGKHIRKGAADAIETFVRGKGGPFPGAVRKEVERLLAKGARRWSSPRTTRCSASFTSRTSSKAASRSGSPNFVAWASRR